MKEQATSQLEINEKFQNPFNFHRDSYQILEKLVKLLKTPVNQVEVSSFEIGKFYKKKTLMQESLHTHKKDFATALKQKTMAAIIARQASQQNQMLNRTKSQAMCFRRHSKS